MSWGKAAQGRMRVDKVVKEDKHGNEAVSVSGRRKALLGFVPCLEVLVETLNEIVVEALHMDVFNLMHGLDRHATGRITVTDNSPGLTHGLDGLQNGKSRISVNKNFQERQRRTVTPIPQKFWFELNIQ